MTPIRTVVVAGANGALGRPVITNLLAVGFEVTALTSNVEKTNSTWQGRITSRKTDYGVHESVVENLRNHDALVDLLGRNEGDTQIKLLDAAIEAGVPHIVPGFFGIDLSIPGNRENPALAPKVRYEAYLTKQVEAGKITYTGIHNGLFFDWSLRTTGIPIVLDGSRPSVIFDGGNSEYSTTALDDVGKAVAAALVKSDQCKNMILFIHSTIMTQNKLLNLAKELRPDKSFKTVDVETAPLFERSMKAWDEGDHSLGTQRGLLPHGTFGRGQHRGLFRHVDNDLLGVKLWSDEDVKDLLSLIMTQKDENK